MGSSMSSTGFGIQHLYFDPDVDSPPRANYFVTNSELQDKLENMVEFNDKINEVRYYVHPLNSWQMSKYLLHHAFIVLKTDDKCWWSIEKDEGGITIQRSKCLENVQKQCRRHDRIIGITSGIDLAKQTSISIITVKELLFHLWGKDYMNSHYHFLENNCKHFANAIFEFVDPLLIRSPIRPSDEL